MGTDSARRRLLSAGLVAACLAALAAAMPSAALAAGTVPALTALSVSSTTLTPEGGVDLSYAAEHPDGSLGQVVAVFADSVGKQYQATAKPAPLAGTVRLTLPDGVRNGLYTLNTLSLYDTALTTGIQYRRDGTTSRGTEHGFDLAALDVTLSGSDEDYSPPVVSAVSVSPPGVKPGEPLTVRWELSEAHETTAIRFNFRHPETGDVVSLFTDASADLAAGVVTQPLKETVYNGTYAMVGLVVRDSLGNTATYSANGSVTNVPAATSTGPRSHTLDLASRTFVVSGATWDADPPALTSMSVTDRDLAGGETANLRYEVADRTAPLGQISFAYRVAGEAFSAWRETAPLVGSVTGVVGSRVGRYELAEVSIMDARGNHAVYRRDGSVSTQPRQSLTKHSLDFTTMDLTVAPSAVHAMAQSRPRAVKLTWSHDAGESADLTGYRVVVNPGGRVVDVPVSGAGGSGSTVVSGLANNREYTFSIASQSRVGPGPSRTVKARPMLSTNIFSSGDINRDQRSDILAYRPSGRWDLYGYRGSGRSGFSGGGFSVDPDLVVSRVVSGGDLVRDGNADHLLLDQMGYLEVHGGDGSGGVRARRTVGRGWGSMRFIDGGSDFSGDGISDILAVWPNGELYLYRGKGDGLVRGGVKIGSGWASMLAVFTPGDFNGDRHADVLAVDPSGRLWLYKGNGRGGWSGKRELAGTGWAGFGAVVPLRDFSGDGRVDLGAVTMSGDLYLYRGSGTGRFTTRSLVGRGWQIYF